VNHLSFATFIITGWSRKKQWILLFSTVLSLNHPVSFKVSWFNKFDWNAGTVLTTPRLTSVFFYQKRVLIFWVLISQEIYNIILV